MDESRICLSANHQRLPPHLHSKGDQSSILGFIHLKNCPAKFEDFKA